MTNKNAMALAYLKALGIKTDMKSFDDRKKIQKVIYLLKQYDPNLKFGYSWYIHGPYSPELAKTVFNPTDENVKLAETMKPDFEVLNKFRNFLESDLYSVGTLELLASIIYLANNGKQDGIVSKEKIIKFIGAKKPQFSSDDICKAYDRIEKSELGHLLNKPS